MARLQFLTQKSTHVVLFKRGLLNAGAVALLLLLQGTLFAQEAQVESKKAVANIESEQGPLDLKVASDGNVSSKGDILRLEETIRGNKEQPKVLSIVPWQLPLHQRIDRNEQRWAPIETKLKPLERNAFLKEIKLLEGIQNGPSRAQKSSSVK